MSVAQEWLSTTVKKRSLPQESSSSDTEEDVPKKLSQNYRGPVPPTTKVKDRFQHWPEVSKLSTARICRMKNCKSRTRVKCTKCNIYLCLTAKNNCFTSFHTNK